MSHKVELWHGGAEGSELCEIMIHWWEVGRNSAIEIADPLAGDVVRNKEATDPRFEVGEDGGQEGIVGIDVSVESEVLANMMKHSKVTYRSPRWRSAAPLGRTHE